MLLIALQLEKPRHVLHEEKAVCAAAIQKLQQQLLQNVIAKTQASLLLERCYRELNLIHKRLDLYFLPALIESDYNFFLIFPKMMHVEHHHFFRK